LTRDECLRSIKLFADQVMPALRAASATESGSPHRASAMGARERR
jgi:hypothetical protein